MTLLQNTNAMEQTMHIIDIASARDLPFEWVGYVSEPSAEVVAHEHHQQYGELPDTMYRRVAPNGRVSWYVRHDAVTPGRDAV